MGKAYRIYRITDENWNPSGIEHWTEKEIFSCADVFGVDRDRINIDLRGRVYCDGIKIGESE